MVALLSRQQASSWHSALMRKPGLLLGKSAENASRVPYDSHDRSKTYGLRHGRVGAVPLLRGWSAVCPASGGNGVATTLHRSCDPIGSRGADGRYAADDISASNGTAVGPCDVEMKVDSQMDEMKRQVGFTQQRLKELEAHLTEAAPLLGMARRVLDALDERENLDLGLDLELQFDAQADPGSRALSLSPQQQALVAALRESEVLTSQLEAVSHERDRLEGELAVMEARLASSDRQLARLAQAHRADTAGGNGNTLLRGGQAGNSVRLLLGGVTLAQDELSNAVTFGRYLAFGSGAAWLPDQPASTGRTSHVGQAGRELCSEIAAFRHRLEATVDVLLAGGAMPVVAEGQVVRQRQRLQHCLLQALQRHVWDSDNSQHGGGGSKGAMHADAAADAAAGHLLGGPHAASSLRPAALSDAAALRRVAEECLWVQLAAGLALEDPSREVPGSDDNNSRAARCRHCPSPELAEAQQWLRLAAGAVHEQLATQGMCSSARTSGQCFGGVRSAAPVKMAGPEAADRRDDDVEGCAEGVPHVSNSSVSRAAQASSLFAACTAALRLLLALRADSKPARLLVSPAGSAVDPGLHCMLSNEARSHEGQKRGGRVRGVAAGRVALSLAPALLLWNHQGRRWVVAVEETIVEQHKFVPAE